MVKIRGEQIPELKHPQNIDNEKLIQNLNCHNNPNKRDFHNYNEYQEDDDNYKTINFNIII